MSHNNANSTSEDPYPVPFEWSDDLFTFDKFPAYDERFWYPQVNGDGLAPFNVHDNEDDFIACPGCEEGEG